MEKQPFELNDGTKAVFAILVGLFGWLTCFVIGKLILGLVFIEVTTPLLVVWGLIVSVAAIFAVGLYTDSETD